MFYKLGKVSSKHVLLYSMTSISIYVMFEIILIIQIVYDFFVQKQ